MSIHLTQQVLENICAHVKEGAPQDQAALLSGIRPNTLENWKTLGRKELRVNPDTDTLCAQLVIGVETARATYYQSLAAVVHKAAITDWVPALAALERRDAANWGKNNYRPSVKINAEDTYKAQFEEIMKNVNEGSLSLNEAHQLSQIVLNAAKADEVSEFRKELNELKAMASRKE